MQNPIHGFRLSPQQRHLWRLQESAPEQPYRAVCAILLEGDLQPRVLEKSFYAVVQRHEILRTTFQRPHGLKTPFQVVSANAHPAWQAVDLSHLDPTHQDHRIEASMVEERLRRYDFERGPLLRVNEFRLSAHRRVMTVSLSALCADAASLTHFVNELSCAYTAILNEQELAGEAMQYADFAEWQHEQHEAEDEHAAQGKAHWEALKSASRSAPALPLEKRNVGSSFSPAVVPLRLDKRLRAQLESQAREHYVSLEGLLFASWQALIWRVTGQTEFVIFKLCDGRKLDDLKGALGLYDAYLPVRCHCDDFSVSTLLAKSGAAISEAQEWQEYFEPGLTVDQIAFEFREHSETLCSAGLTFSIFRQEAVHQPFKLRLSCNSFQDRLAVELEYDPQILDRDSVGRLARYWERLLAQTEAVVTLGAIDILSAADRRQLLSDFNQTVTPYSSDKCIHELFEAQVARTPDAVALVSDDVELTYAQLNARANQLAHVLRERGVVPDGRVGLSLERGADVIVGLLGILKSGGAYVPLNPEHPKERLAFQLAESQASLLVTNAGAIDPSLNFNGETIDLLLHQDLLAQAPQTNLPNTNTPNSLVYVIYTSGSTGVAKGVAVQHRNLVNYSEFVLRLLGVWEPLHFATVSTITADLGNTCIFPALLSGGCLHVLDYEVAMEGELFRDYVARHPLDVLKIVPSHLQSLLAGQPGGDFLPSRFLLLGGEALSWEMADRLAQLKPECQVFNHYGPTETTVGSLTFRLMSEDNRPNSLTVPIGRPIANTSAHVLDRNQQPQPLGVAGELYLGGAGVSAGYLNLAAETAARFIADPFSGVSGARLYRTGDLVRRLADGSIEFLGRIDTQIKVRGFRVELGEIEAVLAAHAAVQQAVVVGASTGEAAMLSSAQRLVAYIVSSSAKPPAADELRNFLQQRLPDYMVPSIFVFLKALPLTANGKVDRAALPAPDDTRPDLQRVFVAPRNDTERELASIGPAC